MKTSKKTKEQMNYELQEKFPNLEIIGDYIGANEKTLIKCKKCGKFFTQKARNHAVGCGCIYCNSSKGENKIIKILDKFDCEFLFQYWLIFTPFR